MLPLMENYILKNPPHTIVTCKFCRHSLLNWLLVLLDTTLEMAPRMTGRDSFNLRWFWEGPRTFYCTFPFPSTPGHPGMDQKTKADPVVGKLRGSEWDGPTEIGSAHSGISLTPRKSTMHIAGLCLFQMMSSAAVQHRLAQPWRTGAGTNPKRTAPPTEGLALFHLAQHALMPHWAQHGLQKESAPCGSPTLLSIAQCLQQLTDSEEGAAPVESPTPLLVEPEVLCRHFQPKS